jgi:hypothetical protein
MSATSRLSLYNGALRMIGEEALLSLTENLPMRRYLDAVWDNGAIDYCLEQGYWYFALRTDKFDADTTLTPNFGYNYVFAKPADWIRTAMLCQDEGFNAPLTQVRDEAGYWYAYLTPLYVSFVSNDNSYGSDLAKWPPSFVQYVQAYLASEIAGRGTASQEMVERIGKSRDRLLLEARNKAAMNESAVFPPVGSWARSRFGRSSSYLDRGNRSQLIG